MGGLIGTAVAGPIGLAAGAVVGAAVGAGGEAADADPDEGFERRSTGTGPVDPIHADNAPSGGEGDRGETE